MPNTPSPKFTDLSRHDRPLAIQAVALADKVENLRYHIGMMLHGSMSPHVVTLDELAGWIDPTRRWNREAFFWCRYVVSRLDLIDERARGERIAREVFKALSPEKQVALTHVLRTAINDNIELFYEGYPRFRPI